MNTQKIVQNLADAIETYRQTFNSYPCPATMDVDRSDVNYGHQSPRCLAKNVLVGNCEDGICVQEAIEGSNYRISSGPIIITDNRAASIPNVRVVIGAIPFRLLQIDEKYTYDAYGSRILYAVTESMTTPGSFDPHNGAIHLVNAQGESLVDPPGSAPFVVVSHGPNQMGGYSNTGAMVEECGGITLDAENCFVFDPSSITLPPILPANPPLAIFAADYRSDGSINQFDDVIDYFIEQSSPKWMRTAADTQNIEAIVEDGVGIDSNNPAATLADALVIPQSTIMYDHDNNSGTGAIAHTGGLRAENSIQAQQFCDQSGLNCFDPRILGGSVAEGMSCPPNKFMTGIANNAPICDDVRLYCPNNAFPVLTGIDAFGAPICSAIPLGACNSLSVQVCSGAPLAPDLKESNQVPQTNPIAMPNSGHGAYKWATDPASYATNPRKAYFYCNNGVWKYVPATASGICNCVVPPSTDPQWVNFACPGDSPSGNAALAQQAWNAFNCQWVYTGAVDYTACACPGPVSPQPADINLACGVGYNTGANNTTFVFNNANNVCNWEPSNTNTCACDPALEGTTNGGTKTDATPYACNTVPGFSTFTGLAYKILTFDGTAGQCKWKHTGWDTSGCSCDTATEHFAYNNPVCDATCEDETRPEKWYFKYIVDINGDCVPGPAYKGVGPTDSAICTPSTFLWKATGGASGGEVASKLGPKKDDPCTCAQKGNSASCWVETSPSMYTHYPCTCQK
ncbi:MAG: hypothetical protein HYS17_08245 [Micavibrio aeruginosavorus]|uniref:Uncharacterized protein n=1 Tax=Micavibrio aeruginosavorus TaxID=349221 RepID=A0A7T5R131_9BACT|nr:MAG: hypothetical protein HYS17_08245 [Micavibrio aeruginosavorus]